MVSISAWAKFKAIDCPSMELSVYTPADMALTTATTPKTTRTVASKTSINVKPSLSGGNAS